MTPETKAKELIEKFRDDPFTSQITTAGAKACALICVEEILDIFYTLKGYTWSGERDKDPMKFWQQVKEHINQTK
jgi:hypothetical protein